MLLLTTSFVWYGVAANRFVYAAPESDVTVSGFSYGGDMAVQAHVAFSKTIKGVCGFASQPIYCAAQRFTREKTVLKGSSKGKGVPFCDGCPLLETLPFDHCRTNPEVVDVGKLPDWPRRNCGHPFRANCLDDVVNMYESRVFLYAGSNDTHTPTAAVANTINWYATMLSDPKRDLKYEIGDAGHQFPVLKQRNKDISSSLGFDGAGQCLTHVLNVSSLRSPAPKVNLDYLHPFDQTNFTRGVRCGSTDCGWSANGLVFVPPQCGVATRCRLHVHLHDCGTRSHPQLPATDGMSMAEEALASYARTNDIVLLMPRLEASDQGAEAPDVSRGCWDVFGQLSGADYARQSSPHLGPLLAMIRSIRPSPDEMATHPEGVHISRPEGVSSSHPEGVPPLLIQDLPQIRIDPDRIVSQGSSSGGDMAIQWQIAFSKHVRGLCGYDAQPWRCAATRFERDVLLPQTHASSVPHCFGCPGNTTIAYDHCKSHADFVNASLLAEAAMAVPTCEDTQGGYDCIDDTANLNRSNIFLTRGECRTYTGNAVINSKDVYDSLGASRILYWDQCNPDGSHKNNDTLRMCLDHVFGPTNRSGRAMPLHNYLFPQAPFVADFNAGFGEFGFVYIPKACQDKSVACGLQVRFHGCGSASPADLATQAYAEANDIVLLDPNVPGLLNGNNASEHCNAGTDVSGNCKEISRGCWDGYGQMSDRYYMQSAAHMRTVWNMVQHLAGHQL